MLALVRVLPDEISDTATEHDHQTDRENSGEYHFIDKHGGLLLCPPVDGSKVATGNVGKIDQDQYWRKVRQEDGDTLTQVKKTAPSARRIVAGSEKIRGLGGLGAPSTRGLAGYRE